MNFGDGVIGGGSNEGINCWERKTVNTIVNNCRHDGDGVWEVLTTEILLK